MWFDANDINADNEPDIYDFISNLGSNRISMWGDKSGNTNNPIQATLTNMPTWSPNSLNFKPVVSFDSSDSQELNIQKFVSIPSIYLLFINKIY